MEYERKSFLVSAPKVINYDIVKYTQQDIYDLEDCLEILSQIVQELQIPGRKRGEICPLMAKYIYMEDSVFEGLEKLGKTADSREAQDRLLDAADIFNQLCYEYQEGWTEEYWEIYEDTRDPQKPMEGDLPISQENISKKLLDLQEIAISLTRISRGPESNTNRENKDLLNKINKEAEMYSTPTITEKQDKRDCGFCEVF